MKGNDYEAWIQYAQNDLAVAMLEMDRTVNPRLRPYEVIPMRAAPAALPATQVGNCVLDCFGVKPRNDGQYEHSLMTTREQ